ncbi:ABC transporter permease [Amycolatopsis orientalis]|uniref:ABC transporter permease n=1 Tax=Amycolatopsis orientalis TaxID=31958 RepID=A0A193BUW6_AMYOR|nr:ABC transporter permease [Amycolatopsis orientalis]ANN15964.1 ABC transporter permease [Amycolatopsis orientalis]
MIRSIPRRLATGAVLLALLTFVVYVGVDLLPGDPVTSRLGPNTSPDRVAELKQHLGLDRPVLTRYGEWVTGLFRGDLGTSASGRPVVDILSGRIGNSAVLAALSVLLLVPLSLVLGLAAASWRGRTADKVLSAGALLLVSVPEFVVASALVLVFAVSLRLVPAVSLVPVGESSLNHPDVLVLPVLSLLLVGLAYAVRVIRASACSVLDSPHVECLRLSGASRGTVLRRAVVPAVLPVAVQVWLVTGVAFAGGAVLVEKVFGYPGIGEPLVASVQSGDLPVVQALVLVLGAAMLAALVLADLAVVLLTPRLRTSAS